ncbi:MAG: ABC transporter substrate-binding protein [Ktedonobacterales bacterium]|nr:ABC transporter substrate-binding protein [Ktedonobacterales bacterium]
MFTHLARQAGGRLSVPGFALVFAALLALAGCGTQTASIRCGVSPTSKTASSASVAASAAVARPLALARASADLGHLTLGLTYVPNIQFAPFYVADALGYYRDAGLSVTFRHHGPSEDEFGAVVAGREDAVFGGGDEVLQARSRGAPLVYIAQIFNKYPVTLIMPANSPVRSAAQLRGCTIGVPGKYGATYIGLLALLHSASLSERDVNIQAIGYTQVAALLTHKVDAVMGYVNNEPIQFQKASFAIRTLDVAGTQPLISNGLAATESVLAARPDALRALVAATLRGVAYTIAHPEDTVNISKRYVTGLSDPAQAANALAVLQATIPLLESGGARPGSSDSAARRSMESFLLAQGQIAKAVDVTSVFTNNYLPS